MYRILASRHPKKTVYKRRIKEIEALIVERLAPVAAEVTDHHDLSALGATAVPTNPRLHEHPHFGEDDMDLETETDVRPTLGDQRNKPR